MPHFGQWYVAGNVVEGNAAGLTRQPRPVFEPEAGLRTGHSMRDFGAGDGRAGATRGASAGASGADERESDAAYGTVSRAVRGVEICDRNLFAGDAAGLNRFWSGRS